MNEDQLLNYIQRQSREQRNMTEQLAAWRMCAVAGWITAITVAFIRWPT